jgi:uncharacterized protein (TIGR03067 family)
MRVSSAGFRHGDWSMADRLSKLTANMAPKLKMEIIDMSQQVVRILQVVVAAGTVLFAVGAGGGAAKGDKELIQGTWTAKEVIELGKKSDDLEMSIEFKGDMVVMKVVSKAKDKAAPFEIKGTFTLDPTKSPKTLDVTVGADSKKDTIFCIYDLKGDQLKICHADASINVRPTAFEPTKMNHVAVFQRQKP